MVCLCKKDDMKVNNVGQENKTVTPSGLLAAGSIGAAAGGLLCRFAPLTTEEHADYFTTSAKDGINKAVKKVRSAEIDKILEESTRKTKLDIDDSLIINNFRNARTIIEENPKKALDFVEGQSNSVKSGFRSLVNRVDKAGLAKQHYDTRALKSAAKASRPIAYFAIAGALIGMAGEIIKNTAFPKIKESDAEQKDKEPLTMADILLEGLGSNTEMLYLIRKRNNESL